MLKIFLKTFWKKLRRNCSKRICSNFLFKTWSRKGLAIHRKCPEKVSRQFEKCRAFLKGKDVHGWKNTNGFSEDPRVAGESPLPAPAAPSICRLERPVFGRFRGRAGEPENSPGGGNGSGRKRPVWPAETSVGPGGKSRGGLFQVCSIGRVSSAGCPESGPETPLFHPMPLPVCTGMHLAARARRCIPY